MPTQKNQPKINEDEVIKLLAKTLWQIFLYQKCGEQKHKKLDRD
jgi:hypothetical protein